MTDRFARLGAALLIAAPIAVAPLGAQNVEYAPSVQKYRLTGSTKGTQTMPTGNMSFEVGVLQEITINLTKAGKDTMKAVMTIDSISVKSGGPVPDLSKVKGAQFTSMISPTGKVYSTHSPESMDPVLGQVVEGVTKMLPTYRTNLAKGFAWSDTIAGKVNQQGLEVNRTMISKYSVAGDTMIGSQKAFKVSRVTSIKAAGAGNMQGMPVTMDSDGTSTGAFFVTPKGLYLGSTSNDDLNVKITIVGQNMEVNIKQNGTTNVEAIK